MSHLTSTIFCPTCQAVRVVRASVRTLQRPHSFYPLQAALVYACAQCGAILHAAQATCRPAPDLVPSST